MNIYESLNKIMADMPHIPKSHRLEYNGRLQYNFRGVDDIYQALQPLLVKYKVISVPEASLIFHERLPTKNGEANRIVLSVKYKFYAEDGTFVDSTIVSEGMDSGDKASNKAMTAGHKYALLQVLCIPTEEPKDSENDHHEIENKAKEINEAINLGVMRGEQKKNITVSKSELTQALKTTNSTSHSSKPTTASQPNAQGAGDYVMTFGKYKDRTVKELIEVHSQPKIMSYISWLQADARDKKKPMNQAATDFIDAFNAFIGVSELDQALTATTKETFDEKMTRLKNQHPGIPGPKHSLPYKEDIEEDIPWPEN